MIPGFSTIKIWTRILHGWLKRLKIQKVIKEILLLCHTQQMWLNCKVTKKWQPPPSSFLHQSPLFRFIPPPLFLAKKFVPPSDSIFGRFYPYSSLPPTLIRGWFQLWLQVKVWSLGWRSIWFSDWRTICRLMNCKSKKYSICRWKNYM